MTEENPKIVVVAGPNGAGKSTVAPSLLRGVLHVPEFVNADTIALVFLWLPSPEIAVARVAERVKAGGHNVPTEVILRRYDAGLRNFFSLYQPMTTSWQFMNNSRPDFLQFVASGAGRKVDKVGDVRVWHEILRDYQDAK